MRFDQKDIALIPNQGVGNSEAPLTKEKIRDFEHMCCHPDKR
jgi:hypothetical protein